MRNTPTPLQAASRHRRSPTHAPARPSEREAIVYLRRELLPELERAERSSLAHDVQRAVKEGSLRPLHQLSAEEKHSLLATLEARLGRRRSGSKTGAQAVVELIGCLDPTPPELLSLERRHAVLPAR